MSTEPPVTPRGSAFAEPGLAGASLSATLRVRGPGRDLVVDVSLEVPAGITILFGPSGSGKSTTLSAIAGLIRPEAGRIAVGDEVWFDSAAGIERPVHRRRVAFVFQSLALFPHMNALDNVAYGIDRAVPRPERLRRASVMLERMRVGHVARRLPRTFSGGEAQRVALARAFAFSPRALLLDEPFSALDRDLRRELCVDVRRAVTDLAVPALVVTHHRSEARALGDRLVVLAAGRVRAAGPLHALLGEIDAASGGGSAAAAIDDMDETPLHDEPVDGPR